LVRSVVASRFALAWSQSQPIAKALDSLGMTTAEIPAISNYDLDLDECWTVLALKKLGLWMWITSPQTLEYRAGHP
jgi:hypothetical protein